MGDGGGLTDWHQAQRALRHFYFVFSSGAVFLEGALRDGVRQGRAVRHRGGPRC